MRLLLAEDETDLNRILTKRLTAQGYSVDSCMDGVEAFDCLDSVSYDGAVLDIMMPGMDGITLVNALRERGNTTPVLFLTARDTVDDRIRGLDSGADDYLVKPFAFEELLARIRVMLRKAAGMVNNRYQVGDLLLDFGSRQVFRDGNEIRLSAKEFSILEYMMRNTGIVLTREQIEDHMWNFDHAGGSNVVDVYIRYLRRKVDDGYDKKLIHTVRGAGYVIKEIP